jgi:hypothetical protein
MLPHHADGHWYRRRAVCAKPRTVVTVVAAVTYAFPNIAANSEVGNIALDKLTAISGYSV